MALKPLGQRCKALIGKAPMSFGG